MTGPEMRALEDRTMATRGISGERLMESAGKALLDPVLALRESAARSQATIRILCGSGNNGGDGFVLARHLFNRGVASETILLGEVASLPKAAAAHWEELQRLGAPTRVVDPQSEKIEWQKLFSETSVVVDALFGIGLKRKIEGGLARLIKALCRSRREGLRVLAVDMPSGIAAETGAVQGIAVEADRTITISLPKIGLTLEPGRSHAGTIEIARIGIEDPDPEELPRVEMWTAKGVAGRFPERPRSAHKGTFGRVLVIAGSKGMIGAATLCVRGSLRAGAGLVRLAHPAGLDGAHRGLCEEAMTAEFAATERGGFARAAGKDLVELAATQDVVVIGPGLGRQAQTCDLVADLCVAIDRPIVLDADGLYALEDGGKGLRDRSAVTILTPHPGEAAKLLSIDVAEINADRIGAARRLAECTASVVILKGAGSVVADAEGRALVIPTGGPVLATGGTGDVLTGMVAALLASSMSAFEAAGLAAWWHGASADRLAAAGVDFGILASEIADALPACAAELIRKSWEEERNAKLVLRFPER
ncbi:MAG: NAD(P)H-hydrate dehydratase [Myxococcota bacterium]